jgi:hypothetical protein
VSAITVGAAQFGPIARSESGSAVVKRLVAHLLATSASESDVIVERTAAASPA